MPCRACWRCSVADFGRDLSASPGLTGRQVSGLDLLTESIARRIRTPKGALFYDVTYGCSLYDYLGEAMNDGGAELCAVLGIEIEEDPRVLNATVTPLEVTLKSISLRADLDTAAGPFVLVIEAGLVGQQFEVQGVTPYGIG